MKFIALTKLPRHAPAQNIGFFEAEACKVMSHLEHIFLIDHHPECFPQNLFDLRMNIFSGRRIAVAFNKFGHHARLRYPRTNNGTGCYQPEIILHLQLLQQVAHGGRFDIKTGHGFAFAEQGFDFRILFEERHIMNIRFPGIRAVFFDDRQRFFDLGQSPLTQNVKLVQADVLGCIHVKKSGGEAFRGHKSGPVVMNAFSRDQYAAGMNAGLVGKIANVLSVFQDKRSDFIAFRPGFSPFDQVLDFGSRQAQDFAQLPHHRPILKGGV